MDPAYLTGLAIFAGSVVGGLTSLTSAWLTKKHETGARRASENSVGRQKLYAQFMDEASKLYVDALVRDQAEPAAMVSIYALISKMRMVSHITVVESAEAVIRTIFTTYSRPNKTSPELQKLTLNREFVDPLLTFSEVCREELHSLPSLETPSRARFRTSFEGCPDRAVPLRASSKFRKSHRSDRSFRHGQHKS
jgi:hypothetical protein